MATLRSDSDAGAVRRPSRPAYPAAGVPAPPGAPPLDDLLALLAAQVDTYEQLLAVADERRGALVAADAAGLGDLVEREQSLLERLRKLEAWRLQIVRPWAARLGAAPEYVTISQLATLGDAPAAAALHAAKERVLGVADRVAAANARNHDLLEACLDSVNASIHHLLQAVQIDPRYASNGNRAGQEDAPRFADLKA